MRSRTLLLACAVFSNFAARAPAVSAHEFWLSPSTYRAAPGDTVAIQAFVGTGFRGEVRPYSAARTERFTMRGARRLDLSPGVISGELRWALFIPPDGGGQLLTYQSNFSFIELPAERFDAYLLAEGLDGPLAARRRLPSRTVPGRERYARCAKTWVAGSDPRRATRPEGLPLEIVPFADPERPIRLPVRVLYRGKPLPNALLRTWNRDLSGGWKPTHAAERDSVAPIQELRTARDGTATLDVRRPGEWLVNVVHMVPNEDGDAAEWQSLWASFTFARKARPR